MLTDWPAPGSLEGPRHDPPHAFSTNEWWYVHAHLQIEGVECSLFASFFQKRDSADSPARHSVLWELVRLDTGDRYGDALLDPHSPQEVLAQLDRTGDGDPLQKAFRKLASAGQVPGPDRLMESPAQVALDRLDLDYGGHTLKATKRGYAIVLVAQDGDPLVDVELIRRKPFVRHGEDGVVPGLGAEDMVYLFCPRCQVAGRARLPTVDGQHRGARRARSSDGALVGVEGAAWFDHEFSQPPVAQGRTRSQEMGWNWVAIQLEDGWDLTAYELFEGDDCVDRQLIVVDPDGHSTAGPSFELVPTRWWLSPHTFTRWPVGWQLRVSDLELGLDLEAPVPNCEFRTLLAWPGFWEGRIDVRGTRNGRPVAGRGFVERRGLGTQPTLPGFLRAVGEETRSQLRSILPVEPTTDDIVRLAARPGYHRQVNDVDAVQVGEALLGPVRHVVDLGGKAWRSYGFLLALELAGGNPADFLHWLAYPELIHVGSLVVDDVQDKSDLRRGGAAAHRLYGEALAINSGTGAYFWGSTLIEDEKLSDSVRAQLYSLYFHTMRAAHAGQAIDIAGHGQRLRQVLVSGDFDGLKRAVLQTHRLKSGVPVGNLTRIAAILAGAPAVLVEAIGEHFENLGVAFQVVDDVLDIEGFSGGAVEQRGEDLRTGKLTFPLALGLNMLSEAPRRHLEDVLTHRKRSHIDVERVLADLEREEVLTSSRTFAKELLDESWNQHIANLPNTRARLILEAFSEFVLNRHY